MKVESKGSNTCVCKFALLENASSIASDVALLNDQLQKNLKTYKPPERITCVKSYDKTLFLGTAGGNIVVLDVGTQGTQIKSNIHSSVSLISQSPS